MAEDRAEGRDAVVGAERAPLGPPSPRERADEEVGALGGQGWEGTGGRSGSAERQAAFSREQGPRVAVSPPLKSGPQSNQPACSCNFLSTVQGAGGRLRGSGQQGHTARAGPVSTVSSPVRGLVGSRQGLGVLWLGKGVRQGPLVKLGNC